MKKQGDVRDHVKKAYGNVAKKRSCCCGPSACCRDTAASTVPDHPVPESDLGLSCGNPLAFGCIRTGDVVLDLGSGAGKDVFLAAQKVGPKGWVIGVDMTPEMLKLARKNAATFSERTGLDNVEFRNGTIEALPVEDSSVNVVISNCVINLSPDKPQVFREAYRVLKPGGKMVVSDIVLNRELPPALKKDADLYSACVAGALLRTEYLQAIRDAGFSPVKALSDRAYTASNAADPATSKSAPVLEGAAASITVLAERPHSGVTHRSGKVRAFPGRRRPT